MRTIVLVNDPDEVVPAQTTTILMEELARRGHQVWVAGVGDLSVGPDGRPASRARRLRASGNRGAANRSALLNALRTTEADLVPFEAVDLLLIRTNPARDPERRIVHDFALGLCRIARDQGLPVLNDPDGLFRAATKLYLQTLAPTVRPFTLISQRADEIRAFIRSIEGPAVVKPVQGTRGQDVFYVASDQDKNLNQLISNLLRNNLVMVQAYLPESSEGDMRVIVLNGRILEVDGHPAAIRRIPSNTDFRSNLHAGGHAEPARITEDVRYTVDLIGPQLVRDGIYLAGLDFIGDQVIEVNVFSTGGLRDAERFAGLSFAAPIVDAFEARARVPEPEPDLPEEDNEAEDAYW